MSISPLEYLRPILEETRYLGDQIEHLQRESPKHLLRQAFHKNATLRRAFVRSVEVIGEASERVPEDARIRYQEIDWESLAGIRDRLTRDLLNVDYDMIWDFATTKVEQLRSGIERMYSAERPRPGEVKTFNRLEKAVLEWFQAKYPRSSLAHRLKAAQLCCRRWDERGGYIADFLTNRHLPPLDPADYGGAFPLPGPAIESEDIDIRGRCYLGLDRGYPTRLVFWPVGDYFRENISEFELVD